MAKKRMVFGGKVLHFKKIRSTQAMAKKLAISGYPEGTVILADSQTAGKGRLNRQWLSPPGGLWFSLILRPQVSPPRVTQLVIPASLSVVRAIKRTVAVDTWIKWPNDIVIAKSEIPACAEASAGRRNPPFSPEDLRVEGKSEIKKVAGILTESDIRGTEVNWVVLGVGINVNNSLSRTLQSTATTLLENSTSKRKISCSKLFHNILIEFRRYYALFIEEGLKSLLNEYKKLLTTDLPEYFCHGKHGMTRRR